MGLRRRACVALVCGATAACAAGASSAAPCPPSRFRSERMLVIAHAGGEGLGPANTLAAMRASMAAGADVNDVDVHTTADGVLVAIHDDTVDATTNGVGLVADHTLAQLQALDAGWRFTAADGTQPFRGAGVRIPTVEEVLTAFPGVLTSIELKDDAGPAPRLLCDLLRRLGRTGDVYVSADTDPPIAELNERCPEVTTTVTDALVPVMRAAQASGAAWCSPVPIGQPPYRAERPPTAASLRWSHDHGLATFTWTVDDPAVLRELARLGVDGVYTRRPDVARAVVDEVAR